MLMHCIRLSLAAVIGLLIAAPPSAALTAFSENFEGLDFEDPNALGNTGWLIFGNVFDSGGNYLFGYGTFPAPNGGSAFSGVVPGEGGPNQGAQQLVVYSDYECCQPSNGHFNGTDLVESNVFQEQTIEAGDVGQTWRFSFDAKRGNIEGNTTALAFIKTIDPNAGFALTNFVMLDMTSVPDLWQENLVLSLFIDAGLEGQLLQFGFLSLSSNFEGSGIIYDNIDFAVVPLPGAFLLLGSGFVALLGLRRRKD